MPWRLSSQMQMAAYSLWPCLESYRSLCYACLNGMDAEIPAATPNGGYLIASAPHG